MASFQYLQRCPHALHAAHYLVRNSPSHGCIRLTDSFATQLFHLTKRGTRVIIARDNVRPFEIANPHLFVSKSTVSNSTESQVATAATGSITTTAADAPSISDVG